MVETNLREIDMYPPIIHQHIIHLDISSLRLLSLRKFNESILKTIPRLLITNDLTTQNRTESTENQFQILAFRNLIQFANEEDIFWRGDIGERKISDHFESESLSASISCSSD